MRPLSVGGTTLLRVRRDTSQDGPLDFGCRSWLNTRYLHTVEPSSGKSESCRKSTDVGTHYRVDIGGLSGWSVLVGQYVRGLRAEYL